MKLIYTILFFCFTLSSAFAQNTCEPDQAFADTLGVFPPPFDTLAENPMGGIDKVACLEEPYEFTFTIAIGDSLRIPGFGAFVIDSIVLSPDTAIAGLPSGLNFECGTPDCVFLRGDLNCVSITGTPDASNALGDYPLTITGTFYSGFLALEQTVPGELFPGSYALRLADPDSEDCTVSSVSLVPKKQKLEMNIVPNPVASYGRLRMNVPESGTYQYRLFNLLGAEVFSTPMRLHAGQNDYDLDLSFLTDGLYIYSLSNGKARVTKRLVIRKNP